jgi:hypothetical protein
MVVKQTRSRKYYKKRTAKQRGGAPWETCDRIDTLEQRLRSGVKAYIYIHGIKSSISGTEYKTTAKDGDVKLLLQANSQAKGELKINLTAGGLPQITSVYYGLETSIPIPTIPAIICPRTFTRVEDESTDITFTFNGIKPGGEPGAPTQYEDIARIKFSYRGDVYIDGDSGRRFTWYLNIKELKIPIYLTVPEAGEPGPQAGAPSAPKNPFSSGRGFKLGGLATKPQPQPPPPTR